ncbi:MAG: TRAM domain-containing protein, partial [Elusimicrobia bacterium]|nr:TRAM domain-containing protein [Elusimicrobiota bacterium]
NRRYTFAHYKELAQKLRAAMPDINITTDFIVGFSGETEEDFNLSLKAAKDIRFSGAFVFKYSPREGTPAYSLKDDVSVDEKKLRHAKLLKLTSEISDEICATMKGKTFRVLGQNFADGKLEAKTEGSYKIYLQNHADLLGKMFNVKITEVKASSLKAEVVNEN